jgi:hypothetical protein
VAEVVKHPIDIALYDGSIILDATAGHSKRLLVFTDTFRPWLFFLSMRARLLRGRSLTRI